MMTGLLLAAGLVLLVGGGAGTGRVAYCTASPRARHASIFARRLRMSRDLRWPSTGKRFAISAQRPRPKASNPCHRAWSSSSDHVDWSCS